MRGDIAFGVLVAFSIFLGQTAEALSTSQEVFVGGVVPAPASFSPSIEFELDAWSPNFPSDAGPIDLERIEFSLHGVARESLGEHGLGILLSFVVPTTEGPADSQVCSLGVFTADTPVISHATASAPVLCPDKQATPLFSYLANGAFVAHLGTVGTERGLAIAGESQLRARFSFAIPEPRAAVLYCVGAAVMALALGNPRAA